MMPTSQIEIQWTPGTHLTPNGKDACFAAWMYEYYGEWWVTNHSNPASTHNPHVDWWVTLTLLLLAGF